MNKFSMYGMEHNVNYMSDYDIVYNFETSVKNLYVAGENTITPGI